MLHAVRFKIASFNVSGWQNDNESVHALENLEIFWKLVLRKSYLTFPSWIVKCCKKWWTEMKREGYNYKKTTTFLCKISCDTHFFNALILRFMFSAILLSPGTFIMRLSLLLLVWIETSNNIHIGERGFGWDKHWSSAWMRQKKRNNVPTFLQMSVGRYWRIRKDITRHWRQSSSRLFYIWTYFIIARNICTFVSENLWKFDYVDFADYVVLLFLVEVYKAGPNGKPSWHETSEMRDRSRKSTRRCLQEDMRKCR